MSQTPVIVCECDECGRAAEARGLGELPAGWCHLVYQSDRRVGTVPLRLTADCCSASCLAQWAETLPARIDTAERVQRERQADWAARP